MANPFSAVPTPHRVYADGRWCFANCAWDAFGISAALRRRRSARDDERRGGDSLVADRAGRPPPTPTAWLFHCAVPAAHWWKDIVFT